MLASLLLQPSNSNGRIRTHACWHLHSHCACQVLHRWLALLQAKQESGIHDMHPADQAQAVPCAYTAELTVLRVTSVPGAM